MADKKTVEETATKDDVATKEAATASTDAQAPAAEPIRPDTTVPGGRFLVDGQLVDANGQPIKE